MSRLREGRANTARGAAHFLRETVSRVRYGGARGQLTVRADSGFYTHALVAVCRRMDVRSPSPSASAPACGISSRRYPEDAWTPIPYWMDGAADVAETDLTPRSRPEADAAPVRLIVRRVKRRPVLNWLSSPPTAITASSPTGTGRRWNWRPIIAVTPRSRTRYATSSTAWG